jgi:choline-sulfatase
MWGEHNCWGKNTFYDDSAKVPLIVSGKRFGIKENQRIKTPVSLLDLYPTFRDMAGIDDWMVPLDGRSLWPALIGEGALTDQPVFSEYYSCDTKGPERMVRYKNFKLNFYYRQGMELFDLESDPHEQINREADPDYQEIKNELLEMLLKNWDPDKIYRDIVIDQNRRTLLGEAIKKCGTAAQTT